jgi:hypothetical protein
MVKLIIGLLVLLMVCVVVGIIRKMRGGTFLPRPDNADQNAPQTLEELSRSRREARR